MTPPPARTSFEPSRGHHGGRLHDQGGRPHVARREAVPDGQPAGLRAASGPAVIHAHAVTLAVALGQAVEIVLPVTHRLAFDLALAHHVAHDVTDDLSELGAGRRT